MMEHELKTWAPFYGDVLSGKKTFELRRYDRPFRVGDSLVLREWDQEAQRYTGRTCERWIEYVLHDASGFGLMDGYAILGLVTR